jgi:hypothetical protein
MKLMSHHNFNIYEDVVALFLFIGASSCEQRNCVVKANRYIPAYYGLHFVR